MGSVTLWLRQLAHGDRTATQGLSDRYFSQLVAFARTKLAARQVRVADEEDVALSAIDSFFRGVERGRFPDLFDWDNLWRLFVEITRCKSIDLHRREGALKHPPIAEQPSAPDGGSSLLRPAVERALDPEPTPAFAAQVTDECRRLLEGLGGEELRSVALLKMEGYTVEEIAGRLGCAPVTVGRKLRRIRTLWAQEVTA
jgi:DNA-directed RNA polymerase specialized sigma24 family protein